jgi:tocopherol cyclase
MLKQKGDIVPVSEYRTKSIVEMKKLNRIIKNKVAGLGDDLRDLCMSCSFHQKKIKYFEGWYFKHQNADTVLAFIPGHSIDERGEKRPFLQIIWNENSYSLDFEEEDYLIDRKRRKIILGNNVFSINGVKVDIQSKDISIQGIIRYGSLSPIEYTIMGPFQFVPFMECRHEIISMAHDLHGILKVNGKALDFHGEKGYIEGDRGRSFPRDYLWLQCNRFQEDASVMVSIAHIPFIGNSFQGCICVIQYHGQEYRFATYLGVKVVCKRETAVILKQGQYTFKIFLTNRNRIKNTGFSHRLLAPDQGKMVRFIKEEHLLMARFLLYKEEERIFDLTSDHVSFEYVPGPENG